MSKSIAYNTETIKICLRCGRDIQGRVLSQRYCAACRQKEMEDGRKERQKIAEQRKMESAAETQWRIDRKYCQSCIYHGSLEYGNNLCDYILHTKQRRGCKAGVGCTKREEQK